jgi:hypothetical protein
MIRLLLFHASYCIAPHALHHLALGSFMLDCVEPEPRVQVEQAQAEDFTNLALDQGKPWCI